MTKKLLGGRAMFWMENFGLDITMGVGVLYGENGGQFNSLVFCHTKIEMFFSERENDLMKRMCVSHERPAR